MTEEELVEKVARAIMMGMEYPEGPDTPCSQLQKSGTWKVVGPLWKVEFSQPARAAIAAMREAMETLAAEQKELPPDFKRALYGNLPKLYADGDT